MKRGSLLAVCFIALWSVSCTKRQTTARIVFVSSTPPPASAPSAEAAGALIVAEPQQPSSEEEAGPPAPEPAERPRTRPRVRLAPPDPAAEPEPEPAPAVEVPALEPREGPTEQAAQRRQAAQLQDQIRARIARQGKSNLSAEERRMLGDARTFLSQSERALAASDFQRARTLARKASMLLAVIEQQ
jgi:type IV secretory pathway VirB10-like protein